ncbi:MAG: YitT family protein [Lachnospiraceae bacterium]|nr:YitT family protein [Lachnospiraceae bacterium]
MSKQLKNQLKTMLMVIIGNMIYAVGIQIFLVPSNIVTAGATGLGLIVTNIIPVKLSYAILVINIVLLLLGLLFLGKEFAINSLVGSLSYPIELMIVERVLGNVVLTKDPLLCTIFLGLSVGISLGIIIHAGASSGGMDIPPIIVNRLFKIPVSVSMYAFDGLIVVGLIQFYDAESILYGIVLVLTYTIVLDKCLMMGSSRVEVKIVSQKTEEIKKAILENMDRGATLISARGGYNDEQFDMIYTVISNRELNKLEKLVKDIDEECFLTVSKATEVRGRGFTLDKQY